MRALHLGPLRAVAAIAAGLGMSVALLVPPSSAAAVQVAPGAAAACSGVQITDATGDGHHANTDITAAWFTSAAGRPQVVLVTKDGAWKPAHDDSLSAGWAVLWSYAGAVHYVRATALQSGALTYDAGTWTVAGGFLSTGPTVGSVSAAGPDGWLMLDLPERAGGVAGSRLAAPFALTYDGAEGAGLHWVDRAPGGTAPDATETGADVIVGPCPGAPAPPGGVAPAEQPISGVLLEAPTLLVGGRPALPITGSVMPARAGVLVTVTKLVRGRATVRTTTTDAAGAFTLRTPITERTQVRAEAAGLASELRTIDVRARVRITVRRTRSGGARITGTVSPRLPGRVLWLREDAVRPSATTRARSGRFAFHLAHPGTGRYQALFLPDHGRAQRGLSNTGVLR